MKGTYPVVQAVVDQLLSARIDIPPLGWILALLSRRRPGPGTSGVPVEENPPNPGGAAELQARPSEKPDPAGRRSPGGCLIMNVASDRALLEDLRRVYAITDNFSMYFYRALGRYDPETLIARFGSWLEACEQAGLITIAGILPGDDLGQEDFLRGLRPCLRCDREFKSQGIHNRLCPRCRARLRH